MKSFRISPILLPSSHFLNFITISVITSHIINKSTVFATGSSGGDFIRSDAFKNSQRINNFVPRQQQWNYVLPSTTSGIKVDKNTQPGQTNPYFSTFNVYNQNKGLKSKQNQNRYKNQNHQQLIKPLSQKGSWLTMGSSRQEVASEPSESFRVPSLSQDIPQIMPFFNVTNVVTLVEMAANDTEIDDQTEELLVQTLSQLSTFIGLQDVRDLLGMFLMYFILGPILIPLFWMPIGLLALGFLAIPLIYNSPLPAMGRGLLTSGAVWNEVGRELSGESQCLEMLSCEFNNIFRSNYWSSWLSKTFGLTQVEWASASAKKKTRRSESGTGNASTETYFQHDDCSKYSCILVKPARRFFGNWYNYMFNYQNSL